MSGWAGWTGCCWCWCVCAGDDSVLVLRGVVLVTMLHIDSAILRNLSAGAQQCIMLLAHPSPPSPPPCLCPPVLIYLLGSPTCCVSLCLPPSPHSPSPRPHTHTEIPEDPYIESTGYWQDISVDQSDDDVWKTTDMGWGVHPEGIRKMLNYIQVRPGFCFICSVKQGFCFFVFCSGFWREGRRCPFWREGRERSQPAGNVWVGGSCRCSCRAAVGYQRGARRLQLTVAQQAATGSTAASSLTVYAAEVAAMHIWGGGVGCMHVLAAFTHTCHLT